MDLRKNAEKESEFSNSIICADKIGLNYENSFAAKNKNRTKQKRTIIDYYAYVSTVRNLGRLKPFKFQVKQMVWRLPVQQ